MIPTLRAIASRPSLQLQIVATGMHLSGDHGKTIRSIRKSGWRIDAVAPWSGKHLASQTGNAAAKLGDVFAKLKTDVVLVVGDRVEAFAAATAGHLCGLVVAHVHGGDRALGQVDDALRHAITKLSHVHFAATAGSAERILKLGEDRWRIHRVGAPGIDGIRETAFPPLEETRKAERGRQNGKSQSLIPALSRKERGKFALLVLHPTSGDARVEKSRAEMVLAATRDIAFDRVVIVYPNNDPGSGGIIKCWRGHARDARLEIHRDVPRNEFLGLMRDAAVLVGNSSSGIIEAASFGTPVVDIGPRQQGRERSENVTNVPFDPVKIRRALEKHWNGGKPKRFTGRNVYGGGAAGKIAAVLADLQIGQALIRKLIAY